MAIVKVFIGGGGDDWISHIVERYFEEYSVANPSCDTHYFSWSRTGEIHTLLSALPRNANISIVGHNYGADTAFHAIDRRVVDLLISIDPVGRFKQSWTAIRAGARVWMNVRAEPSEGRRTRDDTIAWIGGQYGRPPQPGQAGAPNYSYIVDQTHSAFRAMMRAAPRNGPSGKSLLGGASVN